MEDRPSPRRTSHSFVWPLLLIGAGVLFLLANLDVLPVNAWPVIASFWPLALILLGIDILIGRRSTLANIITGLITLLFIAFVFLVVFLAPQIPALSSLTAGAELRTETIQAPLEGIETARITIDWPSGSNSIASLDAGSDDLIAGEIPYYGDLIFDVRKNGSHAEVNLDSRTIGGFFAFGESPGWEVALHPSVTYELAFDTGSGRHDFSLAELELGRFTLDSGSGSIELELPPGSYQARIDGGSGSLQIVLPPTTPVRLELDSGSGQFSVSNRLDLVSGEIDDDGIWETDDYSDGAGILLEIDQGSGRLEVIDAGAPSAN